jgi:acid phosphatase (class A)
VRTVSKLLFALVFAGFSTIGGVVLAQDIKPYVTAQDVDLLKFLAPPPANDSPQTMAEMAQLLAIQASRTPEMEARARTDATIEMARFVEQLGPKFTKEALPKTAAFLARVTASVNPVVDLAKDNWKRLRPHQQNDQIKPSVSLSTSASYPSGTATAGLVMAIVLGNLVPEKRAEIMARGWDLGNQRIVGGIHFPSDVEAARISATLIAFSMMARDDFKSDFEATRKEFREALGL